MTVKIQTEDTTCRTAYDTPMFDMFIKLSNGTRLYLMPVEYSEWDNTEERRARREKVVADVRRELEQLFKDMQVKNASA